MNNEVQEPIQKKTTSGPHFVDFLLILRSPWGALGEQFSLKMGDPQRAFRFFCDILGVWGLLVAILGLLTPPGPHLRTIFGRFW